MMPQHLWEAGPAEVPHGHLRDEDEALGAALEHPLAQHDVLPETFFGKAAERLEVRAPERQVAGWKVSGVAAGSSGPELGKLKQVVRDSNRTAGLCVQHGAADQPSPALHRSASSSQPARSRLAIGVREGQKPSACVGGSQVARPPWPEGGLAPNEAHSGKITHGGRNLGIHGAVYDNHLVRRGDLLPSQCFQAPA